MVAIVIYGWWLLFICLEQKRMKEENGKKRVRKVEIE
jgi:hypothetical protein